MHTKLHRSRLIVKCAIALLACLGAQHSFAAQVPPPVVGPEISPVLEQAKKPARKAVRTKVEEKRIATKPQRPVKQLRPK